MNTSMKKQSRKSVGRMLTMFQAGFAEGDRQDCVPSRPPLRLEEDICETIVLGTHSQDSAEGLEAMGTGMPAIEYGMGSRCICSVNNSGSADRQNAADRHIQRHTMAHGCPSPHSARNPRSSSKTAETKWSSASHCQLRRALEAWESAQLRLKPAHLQICARRIGSTRAVSVATGASVSRATASASRCACDWVCLWRDAVVGAAAALSEQKADIHTSRGARACAAIWPCEYLMCSSPFHGLSQKRAYSALSAPAWGLNMSPEALGFLTAIGVFIILMILLFLYLNNKLGGWVGTEKGSSITVAMAFFKSLDLSSMLDSVTEAMDDLAFAVGDVTYNVSDQLAEQVNTILHKVQPEDQERQRRVEAAERLLRELEQERQASLSLRARDPEAYTTDYSTGSGLSAETFSTCSDHSQTTEGSRGEGCAGTLKGGNDGWEGEEGPGMGRSSSAKGYPRTGKDQVQKSATPSGARVRSGSRDLEVAQSTAPGRGKGQNANMCARTESQVSTRERKKTAGAGAKAGTEVASPADLRSSKKGRGSASVKESTRRGSSRGDSRTPGDGTRKEKSRRNSGKGEVC
ncbi:hypothetical protein JZ751_003197 [Albula glossodonta]|uniref:Uncharacterized protein n=1 Tax=Albula glossodonta TaxID=121402 RepID=A0A8T2N947_9TELE|nr:hypothetical protein JZ751_003197 [Albula glossodonta]